MISFAGSRLTLTVTTNMESDGSFWAHLEATPTYEAMFKKLQSQTSQIKQQYTPVFFNKDDLCSAQFSEDDSWYRGRIVGSEGEKVSCP